jgi:hypothetical protein
MREAVASFTEDSLSESSTQERRASVRYLNTHDAFRYSLGKSSDICLIAKVHDISRDGIGLILNESVDPGTILNVELHSKSQSLPCFLLARVVWMGKQPDGTIMAGCQFSRALSEHELSALL